MCNEEHPAVDFHRVAAVQVCSGRHLDYHFIVEDKVREIITPQAVNKMFQLDFSEQTDEKELGYSQEDKQFFNMVTQGILHTEGGHYEITLPLFLFLQGPDLTNRLEGVHTRFRQEPIAFMGHITQVRGP